MKSEEKLKKALKEILEVESDYFDMEDISSSVKNNIVKKIIQIIKNNEGSENDTK